MQGHRCTCADCHREWYRCDCGSLAQSGLVRAPGAVPRDALRDIVIGFRTYQPGAKLISIPSVVHVPTMHSYGVDLDALQIWGPNDIQTAIKLLTDMIDRDCLSIGSIRPIRQHKLPPHRANGAVLTSVNGSLGKLEHVRQTLVHEHHTDRVVCRFDVAVTF